jgi:hypothetical protein
MYYLIRIILFIFIAVDILFSQNINGNNILFKVNVKKQYILDDDKQSNKNQIFICYNDTIYELKRDKRYYIPTDDIIINKIYQGNKENISFNLPYPEAIYDFSFYNNQLFVLTNTNIHILSIKGQKAIVVKSIPTDNNYSKIKNYQNKIILLESCFSCSNSGIRSAIIDTNGNIISSYEFKVPIGFQLLYHHPTKILDYYHGKFLLSDIVDYKIKIFNENYNQISEIRRDIYNQDTNIVLIDTTAYKYWSKSKKLEDSLSNISRIRLAQFYDDTTIFVTYSDMTKDSLVDQYMHDIWRFDSESKQWILFAKNLSNRRNLNPNDIVLNQFLTNGFFYGYTISDNKIISLQKLPFYIDDIAQQSITNEEYWRLIKEYYAANGEIQSIILYELKE